MIATQHQPIGPCAQCPNRHPDPNGAIPTVAEAESRIRREITRRIQAGNYFRPEPARVDHGGVQFPHHTETMGVPHYSPLPHDLRSDDRANIPPITRLHGDAMGILSAFVGRFGGVPNAKSFPNNPQDHHSLTIALGQRPCTELIPWNQNVANWTDPCPRDRRALGDERLRDGNQRGQSWPCNEEDCQLPAGGIRNQRYDLYQQPTDEFDDTFDDYQQRNRENPPGDPQTHNNKRWVCQYHKRDAEQFWQQDNLIEAHRLPTCKICQRRYRSRYPHGHNSYTCPNLLGRWQCRRCYEKKVRILQMHFAHRVTANYIGDAPYILIRSYNRDLGPGLGVYYWNCNWMLMRRILLRRHPCTDPDLSSRCGRKRAAGNTDVMHCRSCGGVVVTAHQNPYGTRLRTQQAEAGPLQELVFPRGTRGARGNRSGVANDLPANSATAHGTAGAAVATGANAPGTAETVDATSTTVPGTSGANSPGMSQTTSRRSARLTNRGKAT